MAMATAAITMVVTATIMRIDEGARGGRFLPALIAACIGLATIAIAAPRIAAYAAIAPWSSTVPTALAAGAQIEAAPLGDAVQAYARATDWRPSDGLLQQDHARLLMRQGRTTDAIAALRASLAAAPNRTLPWALLAYLEDEAGADGAALAPILRLSRATGPRDAAAMLARAAVSIHHWGELSQDMRAATRSELGRLHDAPWMEPRFFRFYFAQEFAGRIVIRDAVLTTPADIAKFNRAIRAAADLSGAAP